MGIQGAVEKLFNLPPLKEALASLGHLAEGETGQRLDRITARLVKLSGDSDRTMALLAQLERMDQQGTFQRLDELLKDLRPLVRSKGLNALLARLDTLGPLLDKLMKE